MARVLPGADLRDRGALDVTDAVAVDAAVERAGTVIHLAAMTDVDACEREPDVARRVNAEATSHVARAARRRGARLIYLSTNYVFDGGKEAEYLESDEPGPVNVYGRTKLEGERAAASVEDHLVIRSSWIFGAGANFVDRIVARAREGRELRVVEDQVARPTAATALAAAVDFLLSTDVRGVLHVTGDGPRCSWADLAEHALEAAGIDAPVQRISSADYRAAARHVVAARPENSTLSLDRARALGVPLLDWRESIESHVKGAV